MPASPDMAYDLARAVAVLYEDAELALLDKLQRALAEGIDSPRWAELKFASIGNLRAAVEEVSNALMHDADGAIGRAVTEAYRRGGQAAVAELGALPEGLRHAAAKALPNAASVDRLAASAVRDTRPVYARITRAVTDAYRDVINRASTSALLGGLTRRQASQRALDDFAGRGISSFTDKAGRNWEMASYAEMAVRSITGRAAIEGHTDSLLAIGQQLVIVSDAPLECPLCLIPGTVVEGPVPTGRTRSEYTGDVVRIVTASGKDLTGTPDHPVLTPRGWVALKSLAVGDQVISHDREQGFAGVVPDDVQVPTVIEEAGKAWLPVLLAGPARRDFDQDVAYRKVRYIAANSDLPTEFDPSLSEPVPEHLLVGRVRASHALLGLDDGELGLFGAGGSPVGLVHGVEHPGALFGGGDLPPLEESCGGECGPLLVGETSHVLDHGVMPRASGDSSPTQVVADYPTADAEGGAELLRALAGKVAVDEIASLTVSQFSGHVWDLSTEPSWYVANGIVTHNCRPWEGEILSINGASGPHTLRLTSVLSQPRLFRAPDTVPVHVAGSLLEARAAGLFHPNCRHNISAYLPGVTTRPQSPPHPQGATYEDTQKQRYYERQIRAWKRREAVAMDDAAAAKARASIRAYQARIRQLTADTGLPRKSSREQIGAAR